MPQKKNDPSSSRKQKFRIRVLRHFEQVTQNVCATCRHFGIHRSQFYDWRKRFAVSVRCRHLIFTSSNGDA